MDPISLTSIFLACAEAGGFSAASRALNLSRSSVGKAVARLEAQLGVRLFHRTTRSQSLTEDGQLYYEHARRAMAELDAARGAMASGRREPAGVLRVTAPVCLGRHCIAPLLLRFAAAHPRLELAMSFTDRPVDLIEEGYDLAVRIAASLDSTGVAGRRLGAQRMTICAAPDYLARRSAPATPADLESHDLLIYTRANAMRHWRFPDACGRVPAFATKARARFDDLDALAGAAVMGFGLAWLPSYLAKKWLEAGALVEVMPSEPAVVFDIMLLWPQGPQMPMRVRRAIDFLVAEAPALLD
ncbi:LysR family transcriptional regulator [Methylocystis sp. MJC1]|jgi:DNA-binding transcriptional LysR family regulator|uniref:LysR family transcriptional regulator n=1 Tax=Methylocystis sp. MJC1 TaxID=2654282 RepID=UPI0013EB55D0|nr:LysR family transcriptional regulator [Methylocystis sp. MJC1]KAF2991815.1 HTH-type transcriptional regulator DmlR [Methylocystis sp. MJC1]MBU6528918.1 LysR family transcriptional regulator [Methylocystis sp. MJC1]UZX11802.1 LysR family transcriptional regulator [Methylocystis sp. MJC1]